MNEILWVSGKFHLGNNPGVFQDGAFVGHTLSLPFHSIWFDPAASVLSIFIATSDIETWGKGKGHRVFINNTEIGRLSDLNNAGGASPEKFTFSMTPAELTAALGGDTNFLLRIVLEIPVEGASFADDFLVTRITSSENLSARLGWK